MRIVRKQNFLFLWRINKHIKRNIREFHFPPWKFGIHSILEDLEIFNNIIRDGEPYMGISL